MAADTCIRHITHLTNVVSLTHSSEEDAHRMPRKLDVLGELVYDSLGLIPLTPPL